METYVHGISASSYYKISGDTPIKITGSAEEVEVNLGSGQLDLVFTFAAIERFLGKLTAARDLVRQNGIGAEDVVLRG
ncbi:hypothetical protein [Actinosynnema sp. NPDC020468]|uniref:hypothetical protein n=1 Tax=Actinosynnema sp. NPDC020468 TaxID=3154488 RepID=UPI0033E03F1B